MNIVDNSIRCCFFSYISPSSPPPSYPLSLKADSDVQNFQTITGVIKQSKQGKKIGVFAKDGFSGPFVEGWTSSLSEIKVSQVDISAAFAFTSAPKDDREIAVVKVQSVHVCTCMCIVNSRVSCW